MSCARATARRSGSPGRSSSSTSSIVSQRERLLLAALAEGRRSTAELLDAAWSDVPAELRPVAAVSLRAHLDKLEDEGRLPAGVERPSW